MKHIRMFEDSQSASQVISGLSYNTLSAIRSESGVAVTKVEHIGPDTPFYIDVRGPITLAATSGLQMSTDGKTWTDTAAGDLPEGKTYFRVASDQTSSLKPSWTEKSNSDYDIGGNINSLVKINFENDTTCYSFQNFAKSKTHLKNAKDLILPATTLAYGCYQSMFSGCTSLTTAPELPVTTLAENCYQYMFSGCTSLTTAPALPATTLADGCYQSMFSGCTLLITAPALPATTLARNCYSGIFGSCTSLTTAPALPATILAYGCYQSMFSGCTSLTTAPALPATTLAQNCYQYMFQGCTNLNYIKCLAIDISKKYCTGSWVNNVSSIGTFVKDPSMTSWKTGTDGIPSGWTIENDA